MGHIHSKLWDAVEDGDSDMLREILNHKEQVDVNHTKTFKISSSSLLQAPSNSSTSAPPQSPRKHHLKPHEKIIDTTHLLHTDKDSLTPLHFACEKGYREIVRMLLEHGADVGTKAVHERYKEKGT